MIRLTQYLSRSVSVTTGCGANARPSGFSTRWSATSRAASRYFFSSAGDMASDSAELSKPASFAGSTGNSRVGRMSTPRQVADRVVVLGVAQPARRAPGPGSPAFRSASWFRNAAIHSMICLRASAVGLLGLLGRHRAVLELFENRGPLTVVPGDRLRRRVGAQVHVALRLLLAMTSAAIRRHERQHGLAELAFEAFRGHLRFAGWRLRSWNRLGGDSLEREENHEETKSRERTAHLGTGGWTGQLWLGSPAGWVH